MKDWMGMDIAILGYGVVGKGVDTIISAQLDSCAVTRILELPDRLSDERMTASFDEIIDDPSIEAIVECMGGVEPAHSLIVRALSAGKHVITSNKAVVAAYFGEFVALADEHGVGFFIEASTGGGIPWIASIEKARRIDAISSFSGIMNGTSNFIIDAMLRDGSDFGEALSRAQELGYAERDPSADLDGIDVKNKTIISASVAFDAQCTHDLPVSGIRTITKADMEAFAAQGCVVKLLGRGVCRDGRYAASVEPVALPVDSLEAHVPANFNLITLVGETIGELKFYGQGAGMLPTGNAIVQDLLDCAAGIRPGYHFGAKLDYDPALLMGDYCFRSHVAPPDAEPSGDGRWLVRNVSAEAARAAFDRVLSEDPGAFMAALS